MQRCRTVETTREVIKGFHVVYRYSGRDITTTLPYDPGRTVRVAVSVADEQRTAATSGGTQAGDLREFTPHTPASTYVTTPPASDYSYRY